MALTAAQARDNHIVDSMALFLTRNLKVAYDTEVSSLAFPTALTIRAGKPDDASLALTVPRVMVDTISGSERDRAYELGSNVCWRHMNFIFYSFPSTVNGSPSKDAYNLLRSYMRDAFGTKFIKLVDYTAVGLALNNLIYCNDNAEVTNVGDPMPRKATTELAEEKHRFDMHVSIRYPVVESNAT